MHITLEYDVFLNTLRSSVVYTFGHVCLSVVCLSDDSFRKALHRKFVFAHPVYL